MPSHRVGGSALALMSLPRRGTMYRRLREFDAAVEDILKALDMMTELQEDLVQQAQRQLLLTYNDFAVHCYQQGAYQESVLLLNKALKDEQREKSLYINRGGEGAGAARLPKARAGHLRLLREGSRTEGGKEEAFQSLTVPPTNWLQSKECSEIRQLESGAQRLGKPPRAPLTAHPALSAASFRPRPPGVEQTGLGLLGAGAGDPLSPRLGAPDCFFQLGNLTFAEADYQQALELSPQDEGANLRMGLLQEKMGFCEQKSKCARAV